MRFELATPTRIVFGRGSLSELSSQVAGLGRRCLVVTGAHPERTSALEQLRKAGLEVSSQRIPEEPTLPHVREGVALARDVEVDVVVGIGGGSVLDAAKAIAALLKNPGGPLEYLEVIGAGRKLGQASAPFVAVPTTAGTGSEVTRNAVLVSPEHGVKVSLRSASMLPRLALVDPDLTLTVPAAVTASTGLDALTQVIEPFVSHRANPITDAVCREAIPRAARSLRRVYQDGSDSDAREDMSLVSLFGGLALANAGLGAVHGLAGPLGGLLGAPHGALCAALLPHVMRANAAALRERVPRGPALARLEETARLLTGQATATLEDGVSWIAELCQDLAIPGLACHGLSSADCASVIPKARAASSMRGNPVELTDAELAGILAAAR